MDRLNQYRAYIREILAEYSQYRPAYGEIEIEQIIDIEGDHYQRMPIGWQNKQRVHGSTVHIDIRNGKIWTAAYIDVALVRRLRFQVFSSRSPKTSCSLNVVL
ncbi:MAG: XisI protein [Chloroflexaceae bacterium]|nr:XisI protein [Chloroflexaceae bacterium]